MTRARRTFVALVAALTTILVPLTLLAPTASAASGQLGTPQVTLNPGGGLQTDGSDGLRFTLNSATSSAARAGIPGQDGLYYRGTQQYCCSAGAPMLNVGGTLFGQAGPAYDSSVASWTSLSLVSTSGSATAGAFTSTTGNGRAVVRYTATKNGLVYTMDRTVSYTYPNDFVTDSYEFTIPDGNTDAVKFYLGGDTAPGNSDQGYGVMLTSPVRSVISLNTSSQIQFGIREVGDSKRFDGATSQSFYDPYPTVTQGGDIGFVATASQHDAGLMVQWNLGSTPGSQSASLEQFVNKQGTNLTASVDRTNTQPGVPVSLSLSVANTFLAPVSDLGYTFDLPPGVTVGGDASSNCGGTLGAAPGATQIVLSGGSVGATTNCVVTVPVVATTYGTYTISRDSVTTISAGLTNNVGTSSFFVPQPPAYADDAAFGDLTVGSATTQSVATSVGTPAPTYAVTGGSLPAGLRLDPDTGTVTGTPGVGGPYSFVITATNAGGTAAHTFSGTVARGTPSLSGSADPSGPYFDQTIVLSADLPSSTTGDLTFRTPDRTLCTVTLPARSCTVDDLEPGTYAVEVAYSGDESWEPRTVSLPSLTVSKAVAAVGGSLADDTIEYGTTTIITASVDRAADGATGTIAVTSGSRAICTITLPDTQCTTPDDLRAGERPIALSYSGDDHYLASSAVIGPLTVERTTPNPDADNNYTGTYGRKTVVTLKGLPARASGTVTVSVDGDEVCTYTLGDDPEACDVPATLAAGTHDLRLAYSGDDNYDAVTTNAQLLIDKASTAVKAPATASGTYGTATTVKVSGLPDGATGTVTLKSGDTVLCSFTVPDEDGCAIPATFPAGDTSVLVVYSGDSNYLGSNDTVALSIAKQLTDVRSQSPDPTPFGTPATVSVRGLPSGTTGVVTVTGTDAEGTSIGTVCTIDLGADETSCNTPGNLPAGTYTLTVRYPGDANHAASETEISLTVTKQATTVSTPATIAATYGDLIDISAGTLPTGASGTVTVKEGSKTLCTYEVPDASSCPVDLGAGEHTLTIIYSGDDNFARDEATSVVTVAKAAPQLTASATSTTFGSPGVVRIAGLPASATGEVTVSVVSRADLRLAARVRKAALGDPDSTVCTIDLESMVTDRCDTNPALPAGDYILAVKYPGDKNLLGSQDDVAFSVAKATSEVDPGTAEVTSTYGKAPKLKFANVKDLTGEVVVTYVGPDGQTGEFCQFTLPEETTCTGPDDLPVGTYTLTWSYGGDANHGRSTSTTTLVIGTAATQITTEDEFSNEQGSPTTITFGGLPDDATGEVVITSGTTVVCTIDVTQADSCTAVFAIALGSYDLTLTYSGDAAYEGSAVDSILTVTAAADGSSSGGSSSGGSSSGGSSSGGSSSGGTTLASTGGPGLLVMLLALGLSTAGAILVGRRRRNQG